MVVFYWYVNFFAVVSLIFWGVFYEVLPLIIILMLLARVDEVFRDFVELYSRIIS